jgi:5'-3' exonuclease
MKGLQMNKLNPAKPPLILVIDGMNFLHRARSGFTLGDHAVRYNFFRNLRALVEQHSPTRVYFVLEGHPKKRYELLPEYKANRKVAVGTPEFEEMKKFHEQVDLAVNLLTQYFPVSVIRHPDYECDDVIYNLIKRSSTTVPWIVVSNDSDFTQLLDEFEHVKLYNPMKKEFVTKCDYDYVTWKALRGDPSDNVPGIFSDARALELVNDPVALSEVFSNDEHAKAFTRNYALIKFPEWTDDERKLMTSSEPHRDWNAVGTVFSVWEFKSMLKEKYWERFTSTFDSLWRT